MRIALLVAVACIFCLASCQNDNCVYPTTNSIGNAIEDVLRTGDAGSTIEVDVVRYQPLCLASSRERDRYRGVSVLVQYNCMLHSACPSSQPAVEQFEFGCESGEWTSTVAGATSGQRTTSPSANFSTSLRQDCAFCLSATSATSVSQPPPGDTLRNCISCDPGCDEGLMRCYGLGSSKCCKFYSRSQCVDECPSPFQNNSDSVCVCPVGTTGTNCEETIDCGPLVDPENGEVAVTNTTFNSTATYSCNDGYSLVGVASITCLGTGLWSGSPPTCMAVDCGVLADPANGRVTVSNTTFTSTASYSCNSGYNLVGVASRTCQASESWSGTQPSCCTSNCIECDESSCKKCGEDYKLDSGICRCVVTGCSSCDSDPSKCDVCENGRSLDDTKSACITSDGGGGGDKGLSPGAIVGIIIAIIVAAILLALLTALIIFLVKKYWWDKIHLKSKDLEALPSTNHLNPLYIAPIDIVDKGPTTPTNGEALLPSEGGKGGSEGGEGGEGGEGREGGDVPDSNGSE